MAELARGTVADRPWGRTLGALGMRALTGQLTLVGDGKRYCIAFENGAVIGASSPLINDAAVRVALTGGLISSTQVADLTRRFAAAPDREEVSIIAEYARLTSDQAMKLRRRIVAQRAARTFTVEIGEFLVEDTISIPVYGGSELDVRTIIYLGARSNMSESRLATELGQVGGYFRMKPEAQDSLPQFGFGENERPILMKLAAGSSLIDLEEMPSELNTHGVHAVVYALVSCGSCEVGPAPIERRTPSHPPTSRTSTPASGRAASVTSSQRAQTPAAGHPLPRTTPPTGYAPALPVETRRSTIPPIEPEPVMSRTRTPVAGDSGVSLPRTNTGADRQPRSPSDSSPGPNGGSERSSGTQPPPIAVARTPSPIAVGRTPSPNDGAAVIVSQPASGSNPNLARTQTPSTSKTPSGSHPAVPRTPTPQQQQATGRTPTGQQPPLQNPSPGQKKSLEARDTEALINDKVSLLDTGADHFKLLGVAQDASADEVRNTYFQLARKLHPDRLASLGIVDPNRNAQRLFAQINTAFGVLTNPQARADYVQILMRGGENVVKAEEAKVEDNVSRVMRAEEAYRRGEMALRRDQIALAIQEFQQAVELQPNEADYQALLAWARFAGAPDKVAIAQATRAALSKAIEMATNSVTPRFYMGRVERMLGREKEALNHFQQVLMIKPHHAEASSEVRVLEQRLRGKR